MAATLRMKVPVKRWRSLCSWVKAETEGPMVDKINTGVPEGLMQRLGHFQETGEGDWKELFQELAKTNYAGGKKNQWG